MRRLRRDSGWVHCPHCPAAREGAGRPGRPGPRITNPESTFISRLVMRYFPRAPRRRPRARRATPETEGRRAGKKKGRKKSLWRIVVEFYVVAAGLPVASKRERCCRVACREAGPRGGLGGRLGRVPRLILCRRRGCRGPPARRRLDAGGPAGSGASPRCPAAPRDATARHAANTGRGATA